MSYKTFAVLAILSLVACHDGDVLNKKTFRVVDTLGVSKNGFGYTMGYDVIIEYNNEYYSGYVCTEGRLTELNFKPINICGK